MKWKFCSFCVAEVKQMARRVASGRLGLSCPCPAGEYTSESEAESVKESLQRVPARAPKSHEQQRCRWQPGDAAEPWDVGSEDRTESGESDPEPALRSSTGEAEKQKPLCSLFVSFHFQSDFSFCDFLQELSVLSSRVFPSEQVSHSLMGINRDKMSIGY